MNLSDFRVGDRVELAPHTDAWMSGDRFGHVDKIGRTYVHVIMNRSGRTLRVGPSDLTKV